MFAGDEYKNEEPRGNIQDLNAAFLQDEAPPLQLQLDPQEETSQKMPPKKVDYNIFNLIQILPRSHLNLTSPSFLEMQETVAPMIQVKKRAPVLHISSSTLPNAAAAAAATSIVKISNQAPAPASTDNDTDAQHLAPTIVKKDAKVIKSRSKPMAVPIPNSSSQPAQLDAPFPSKV